MERYFVLIFGRTNIVQMSILLKAIHGFDVIPIKITMAFFREIEQTILKFVWNRKRSQITKVIFKKNKTGNIMCLDFKLY